MIRVIVDFIGQPIEFLPSGEFRKLQDFHGIGEADCKLPRWVDYILMHSPVQQQQPVRMVVEATDSDYIMIAMLHHEHIQKRKRTCHVSIRRIKTHILPAVRDGRSKSGPDAAAAQGLALDKRKKSGREWEFVHIPLLYEVWTRKMEHMFQTSCTMTPMNCLVGLISLTGNDFCRGIPSIGPKRMWSLVSHICSGLFLVSNLYSMHGKAEPEESSEYVVNTGVPLVLEEEQLPGFFNLDVICNRILAAEVYAQIYRHHHHLLHEVVTLDPSHPDACGLLIPLLLLLTLDHGQDLVMQDGFRRLEREIRLSSKLSQKSRDSFPTCKTLETTIRNASWTLAYWRWCVAEYHSGKRWPDPMLLVMLDPPLQGQCACACKSHTHTSDTSEAGVSFSARDGEEPSRKKKPYPIFGFRMDSQSGRATWADE